MFLYMPHVRTVQLTPRFTAKETTETWTCLGCGATRYKITTVVYFKSEVMDKHVETGILD